MKFKFDLNRWEDWTKSQIAQDQLLRCVPIQNMIFELCRELYESSRLASFASRPLLLWPRCTPGENLDRWPDDPRDVGLTCLAPQEIPESDTERLKSALARVGLTSLESYPVQPDRFAFEFADGRIPEGWTFHHLYDGQVRFDDRKRTLDAQKHGTHFTQTAGMTAVHPMIEELYPYYPCIPKVLRARAFRAFGYDPDNYFSSAAKDDLGFIQNNRVHEDEDLPPQDETPLGRRVRERIAELTDGRRRAKPRPGVDAI
jgi:hypothetical protein